MKQQPSILAILGAIALAIQTLAVLPQTTWVLRYLPFLAPLGTGTWLIVSSHLGFLFLGIILLVVSVVLYQRAKSTSIGIISIRRAPSITPLTAILIFPRGETVWRMIENTFGDYHADGPYCRKCMRELNESSKRTFMGRKVVYKCPLCGTTIPKTDADEPREVEKDFMALLRQGHRFQKEPFH